MQHDNSKNLGNASMEIRVFWAATTMFIPNSCHQIFFPEIKIGYTEMFSMAWQTRIHQQFSSKHNHIHESSKRKSNIKIAQEQKFPEIKIKYTDMII